MSSASVACILEPAALTARSIDFTTSARREPPPRAAAARHPHGPAVRPAAGGPREKKRRNWRL
eukprot:5910308-Prymnesium_polylepis.1